MNIFDLAEVEEATAYRLVNETLAAFPDLRNLYDEDFVKKLVKRRGNYDNFLLLLLVQVEDEVAAKFWTTTLDDLAVLAPRGSWQAFFSKFRKRGHFDIQSAKSELTLAAWMERNGAPVVLEPLVNGLRGCDFMAETQPRTWWEIKSPGDLRVVKENERIELEVQAGLRRIQQPYVLALDEIDRKKLSPAEVPKAVKEIKRKIGKFHESGGRLPHAVESHGLRIAITGRTKSVPYGYLGTMSHSYTFKNQYMKLALSRISSAIGQLPADSAGIVVIDATAAHWLDEHDVVDACFGEEVFGQYGGQIGAIRLPGGAFHPGHRTRISAVVYYTRSPDDWERDFEMVVLHNPFARVPLAPGTLQFQGVRQLVCFALGEGRYRLEAVAS